MRDRSKILTYYFYIFLSYPLPFQQHHGRTYYPEEIILGRRKRVYILTHWGRVTHICVNKLTIIGSDNGLSPDRRQAIILTNAGLLLIGPLGTYFREILIEILTFSFKKIHLKMSSAKLRSFVSASMCKSSHDGSGFTGRVCRNLAPLAENLPLDVFAVRHMKFRTKQDCRWSISRVVQDTGWNLLTSK